MIIKLDYKDSVLQFEPEFPIDAQSYYDFTFDDDNLCGNLELRIAVPYNDLPSAVCRLSTKEHGNFYHEASCVFKKEGDSLVVNIHTTQPVRALRIITQNVFLSSYHQIIISGLNNQPKDNLLDLDKVKPAPPTLPDRKHVDILLTTYNGENYIKEQLDSILNQTYQDFRIIISDDCSSDGTLAILQEYAQKDPRIVIADSEENLGYIKNFEKLMYLSNADYIAFSDQDDYWLPTKIEETLTQLKQTGYSAAYCDLEVVDEHMQHIHPSFWELMALDVQSGKTNKTHMSGNFITGCTLLIPDETLRLALPLNNTLPHDYQIANIASQLNGVCPIHQALVRYRQHPNNAIGAYSDLIELIYAKHGKHHHMRHKMFFNMQERTQHVEHSFIAPEDIDSFRLDPSMRLCRVKNVEILINGRQVFDFASPNNFRIYQEYYFARNRDPQFICAFPLKKDDVVHVSFDIEYAWAENI